MGRLPSQYTASLLAVLVTVIFVPAGTLPLLAPEYPPPEKTHHWQLTL